MTKCLANVAKVSDMTQEGRSHETTMYLLKTAAEMLTAHSETVNGPRDGNPYISGPQ